MKKLALLIFGLLFGGNATAAVPYDHVHLTATNAQEAVNWYVKHFGGKAGRFTRGDGDTVQYPIERISLEYIFEHSDSCVERDAELIGEFLTQQALIESENTQRPNSFDFDEETPRPHAH